MLLLNKKTSFSGVSWWYGTIVGSLFNGGSKIFLRGWGGGEFTTKEYGRNLLVV